MHDLNLHDPLSVYLCVCALNVPFSLNHNPLEECGALESVKAASELISPVSGEVIEKNEIVENKPGLINTSCYEKGWLYKVKLSNLDEIKRLMNEESYNAFLKSNAH